MFKASGRILVLVATFLSGCCWDRSEYGPSRTFGSFLDEWNSCRTFSFTYLIARHTYGYTICFYLYKSDIYIYISHISGRSAMEELKEALLQKAPPGWNGISISVYCGTLVSCIFKYTVFHQLFSINPTLYIYIYM